MLTIVKMGARSKYLSQAKKITNTRDGLFKGGSLKQDLWFSQIFKPHKLAGCRFAIFPQCCGIVDQSETDKGAKHTIYLEYNLDM